VLDSMHALAPRTLSTQCLPMHHFPLVCPPHGSHQDHRVQLESLRQRSELVDALRDASPPLIVEIAVQQAQVSKVWLLNRTPRRFSRSSQCQERLVWYDGCQHRLVIVLATLRGQQFQSQLALHVAGEAPQRSYDRVERAIQSYRVIQRDVRLKVRLCRLKPDGVT
jgi:hypothetical protein